MRIKDIVVAGAGTMGYSIAQIFAGFNYKVTIYDLKEEALEKARTRIKENIRILTEAKELSESQNRIIHNNLSYTTNLACFKNCDLVIESIIEDSKIKKDFYRQISKLVKERTIIATNTSGISINNLAEAVNKPERFIGMHWFNPPHLIPLIEIIKGDQTNEEIAQMIKELSLNIAKKPVIVQKDVLGFVANRIQFAVLREALYLVDQGVIAKEDVDDVMKYGLGLRYACLGPLEIADLGGLDTFYHISKYLMADLCNDGGVPKLLNDCYRQEQFGIKSKKGFYDYSAGKDLLAITMRDDKLLKIFKALY